MIRIPNYSEDLEKHWGFADFKNKLVLDIGGSYGDSADLFLRHGARAVIAIDCNQDLIRQCRENSRKFCLPLVCICLTVDSAQTWEHLIEMFKPDLVKSDCEGCEIYLVEVQDSILQEVPEYLIETHSDEIQKAIESKFRNNGYEMVASFDLAPNVRVNYFRKR